MLQNLEEVLHPRIIKHCKKLVHDAHYKHAALEAMMQVEIALKEKTGIKNQYGKRFIKSILGKDHGIKLKVPFGEDEREYAKSLFDGAFAYYRNYAAHEGSKIDRIICIRILILASELLDLIGASEVSFAEIGGVDGLLKAGIFNHKQQIHDLLDFLNNRVLPGHECDGFYEELGYMEVGETQIKAVIELDLVEYITKPYIPSEINEIGAPEELGFFELTNLGTNILKDLEK